MGVSRSNKEGIKHARKKTSMVIPVVFPIFLWFFVDAFSRIKNVFVTRGNRSLIRKTVRQYGQPSVRAATGLTAPQFGQVMDIRVSSCSFGVWTTVSYIVSSVTRSYIMPVEFWNCRCLSTPSYMRSTVYQDVFRGTLVVPIVSLFTGDVCCIIRMPFRAILSF